jgi:uncharacterized membrane protein YfcA
MAFVMLIPMHVVVATSMFTMILTSFLGVSQHYTFDNIYLTYALLLAVGVVVGGQVGAWLCKKVTSQNLRRIFAVAHSCQRGYDS